MQRNSILIKLDPDIKRAENEDIKNLKKYKVHKLIKEIRGKYRNSWGDV